MCAILKQVRYIDCREHGNMARLANDSSSPNLALRYLPTPGESGELLPRRAFLVALDDIRAGTELTWNYGEHYPRDLLERRAVAEAEAEVAGSTSSAHLQADRRSRRLHCHGP